MCLTIVSGPHIADSDIEVWKVIRASDESLHLLFQYVPDTLYPMINIKPVMGLIEEGYHSYSFEKGKSRYKLFDCVDLKLKLVKFIIPAGAKYYIGDNADIVSTSIRSGDLIHQQNNRKRENVFICLK